ncbi:MAG TPA: radical SAM protein [Candidatus Acidoferrum sp.]|nr:radical SAM protein [Candidatus Acidoferrum sp.]
MKFPLRLSWDLWRSRLAPTAAIVHLPAALLPALHDDEPVQLANEVGHSAADSLRTAAKTDAPVVWIGGSEPLEHAEIGRVAFALNRKGRNVFVHTNGQRLRQRIHEFRPEPRLFLTVEVAGREEIHDRAAERPGAFQRLIEGIRAAKLSGFHVCAHVTVTDATDACDAGELFEYLDRYDVDGFIVSSGGERLGADDAAGQEKLEEVRSLVRCSRWENFSRLLQQSYAVRGEKSEEAVSAASVADREAEVFEESA